MARSFSLVEHKVAEADFFLSQIPACEYNFFGAQCYVAAFASSARSVTFALQSCLADVVGFKEWYAEQQASLRSDPLARFFHEFRRVNQHIGENLVGGGSGGPNIKPLYWFTPTRELPHVPSEDVETACTNYMRAVVAVVYQCYIDFGPQVDPHQHYTAENFADLSRTIEDAEEELGFPRGWTDIGRADLLPYRWQALRDAVGGSQVNHIFQKYLEATAPSPDRLPDLQL
jgi:hypothetical protein